MPSQLFTTPNEVQTLESTLTMPYTLTTGRATGTFLAALAHHRIVGSRCVACSRVVVPAQDVCTRCGAQTPDFVEVPPTGRVSTWTSTVDGIVVMVRLDGTDTDLMHRYLGDEVELAEGKRVGATWAEQTTQWIVDLAGFIAAADGSPVGELKPFTDPVDAVVELPYQLDLHYRHAYGPYYGRMFDELGSQRRLIGSRCSSCHNVLVPPRALCDVCYRPTDQFEEVAETGTLQAFSVIHMEFVGQTRKPPYVYAEIVLDGSSTRLIHTVGGVDVTKASELLRVGMPVRAVWRDAALAKGTLEDIDHFAPISDKR